MIERLPVQGLVTVGVYKDVDVSAEIDGLSNMQDIAEAGSQYRVSSKATHRKIKGGSNYMQPGCNAQGIRREMKATKN